MPYALTSARCVLPTDAYVEFCAQRGERDPAFDEWKTYGVPFQDDTAASLLQVDSPGLYEITMKMKSLDDLAREYENNMRYKQARPAQAKNEPVSPADLRFWTRFNDTLTWIKAERGQLQKYLDNKSYEFGAVVATSGLTSRQQEPRFSQSPCPSKGVLDPPAELVGSWYLGDQLKPGQSLYTIGHSKAKTRRTYNGLRTAWITHTTVGHSEERGEPLVHYVHSMYYLYKWVMMMLWGDSGSMVFDGGGYVVGMCFEGNAHGDTAYFMYWEDLWEDILKKSGAKDIRFLGDEYSYRGFPLEMEWLALRMLSRCLGYKVAGYV
ncbi:hypothetical protein BO99DRAFT_131321 [Aspergillus violaceofuscus CBS 115571]|uniref:Uncharacterized protein n=1 Tax=Aspergillus violaceofuscus (strain CBS 115571) TaxID=1450538 RepID=A0A2V5IJD5_ASPV1|nr:hypothetical protein BO99DRAFT_131321 [Aspergillus violaceofuscus CBS 115571]